MQKIRSVNILDFNIHVCIHVQLVVYIGKAR